MNDGPFPEDCMIQGEKLTIVQIGVINENCGSVAHCQHETVKVALYSAAENS